MERAMERIRMQAIKAMVGARQGVERGALGFKRKMEESKGQGTAEYAILVGVLVLIAIAGINLFKGHFEELWNEIAASINAL